jgi:hypothetical protein
MGATLDRIIEQVRALPADEQRQRRELLEREARPALARSIRGKYAHLTTSSEAFITQKHEETRREDSKFRDCP